MKVQDRVTAILKGKSDRVWTVETDSTVYDALTLMAEHSIGAVPVMTKGRLAGLLSERDYARKVILHGRSSKETLVSEIMATPPVTITTQCTVDEAMHLMTDERTRHLPVVNDRGEVEGLLSIGDLVKWIISSQDQTIEHLQTYIAGNV